MFIQTNRCVIRNMTWKDEHALYEILSDPEVMAYLEPPFSKEQTKDFLRDVGLSEQPLIYSVCHKEDACMIGYLIFHPYEADIYELGWVLNKKYWHMGIAEELTQEVVRYAKQEKIPAVVIECVPEQKASIAIAEKNGFSFCGTQERCNVYRLNLNK